MREPDKPTAVDLFCGAGGLSLGFERAGFKILLATDFDRYCGETYNKNFPHIPFIKGDVAKLSAKVIRDIIGSSHVNVLLGGPPCQGFSTIGNRASSDPKKREREDRRNMLFREYIRILKQLKPDYFVMENVKGMLTLQGGEFFIKMLKKFRQSGYKNIDYRLLNAADYGVPQIRHRVFLIGNRLGQEVSFPEPTHSNKHVTVGQVIRDLINKKNVPNHIVLSHGPTNIERYKLIPEGGRLPEHNLPVHLFRKNFGNTFKRLHRERPALTMVPGHNAFPIHPVLHRSLTPREAARIQGFPDNIIFEGPRQSQCSQIGNAVPPLLAQRVALNLKRLLTLQIVNGS